MEHTYIEENNLIDRYVRGTLPVDTRTAFEEHFLDCTECLDQLEVARSLRDAIRLSAVDLTAAADTAPTQTIAGGWRGGWAWRWLSLAVTACLGIAVLAGGLLYQRLERTRQELAQNRLTSVHDLEKMRQSIESVPQAPPMVYVLNQSRGSTEPVKTISIPATPRWIVLSAELDTSQFRGYRVILRDATNQTIWRNDQLSAGSPDAIAVSIPSTLFKPGSYGLQVLGLDSRSSYVEVASFALKATRSE
jgi:hypothetical protein